MEESSALREIAELLEELAMLCDGRNDLTAEKCRGYAAHLREPMWRAVEMLTDERHRQIEELGYTAEHDRQHTLKEWADLIERHQFNAASYGDIEYPEYSVQAARRELMKVGALALAALEPTHA